MIYLKDEIISYAHDWDKTILLLTNGKKRWQIKNLSNSRQPNISVC